MFERFLLIWYDIGSTGLALLTYCSDQYISVMVISRQANLNTLHKHSQAMNTKKNTHNEVQWSPFPLRSVGSSFNLLIHSHIELDVPLTHADDAGTDRIPGLKGAELSWRTPNSIKAWRNKWRTNPIWFACLGEKHKIRRLYMRQLPAWSGPTPSGVPVRIKSPGSKVKTLLISTISWGMCQIISCHCHSLKKGRDFLGRPG